MARLFLRLHGLSYRLAGAAGQYASEEGLHPKHRLCRYHEWFEQQVESDWVVLDAGCGNGYVAHCVANYCRQVIGVDIDPSSVVVARERYAEDKIDYRRADITTMSFPEQFDAVMLSNVLEHIDDRTGFLRRLRTMQESPPLLLIRVPMIDRSWVPLYKQELGLEWRLDPDHRTEYTLRSLQEELSSAGWQIRRHEVRFGEVFCVAEPKAAR